MFVGDLCRSYPFSLGFGPGFLFVCVLDNDLHIMAWRGIDEFAAF